MEERLKIRLAQNAIYSAQGALELLYRNRDLLFTDKQVAECYYTMNKTWLYLSERSDEIATGDK